MNAMGLRQAIALAGSWRTTLPAIVLVLFAVLLLYRETVAAMVSIWYRSGTFAHAFLVPPIVLWLVWRQRAELARQTPAPAAWLLLPLAFVGVVWLLGDLGGVNAAAQLALVALVVLGVLAIIGFAASRSIWFALGFLFFAAPIGEFLMPQMMTWTADFTVIALRLSGIPVYRDGLQFVIPSGNWSVVEACSGVRYLIASVMVGMLFAYLNYRSWKRRIIFVAVSFAVPIVANWILAYLIVLLGHLSNNKLAAGADHLIYGWLFFGVVMLLMFTIGTRWVEPDSAAQAPARAPPARELSARWSWAVAGAAALIVALPHALVRAVGEVDNGTTVRIAELQPAPPWRAREPHGPAFTPAFKDPVATTQRTYTKGSIDVSVYVAYYRYQDYQRKLVSSTNVLVTSDDPHWAQTASGVRKLRLPDREISVRTARLRSARQTSSSVQYGRVAWQLYWINGTLTSSDALAKAYGAMHRLAGRGDDAAVIIVYADDDTAGSAEAELESFLRDNLVAIQAQLQRSRGSE